MARREPQGACLAGPSNDQLETMASDELDKPQLAALVG